MKRALFSSLFGLSMLCLFGCPKSDDTPKPADAGAPDAAKAGDAAAAESDDVEPVYKIDPKAPIHPLAAKLCKILSELPEKKRAACCNTAPGIVMTDVCAPTLSAALKASAVQLAEGEVEQCETAYQKTLEGCDWVGPFPPAPPEKCLGIVHGLLASGAVCRSSLECTGSLRCLGSGPTTKGKCGPVKNDGDLCGGTVDPLAGFLRQTSDLDRQHPECKERCVRHKCSAPVDADGECQVTADCKDGLQCLGATAGAPKLGGQVGKKKCVAGKLPGKDGEACPGGECEKGLSCIRGKCTVRKGTGEACTDDFECKGGCLRGDAGSKGTCGPRCDIR